jgi:hypothetical protein
MCSHVFYLPMPGCLSVHLDSSAGGSVRLFAEIHSSHAVLPFVTRELLTDAPVIHGRSVRDIIRAKSKSEVEYEVFWLCLQGSKHRLPQ